MKKSTRKLLKRAPITPHDLFKLRLAGTPALSHDEKRVIYAVERMDEKENKYFSNLFMLDVQSSQSWQFTVGDHNDSSPAWSPDDKKLAFISTRDKKTAIYIMPTEGGSERKLLELEGSFGDLQWSPDGNHLVFALRYSDSHFIEDENKKKEAPVYRHITRFFYRLDGFGFLPKDRFQIYSLELSSGKLKKLTRGKHDNHSPNISRDGRWIAFVSNRSKDPDLAQLRDDLFIMPFGGGRERRISTPAGPVALPKFAPDGRTIAYIGHDNPDDEWGVTNLHLWKVGVNVPPKAHDLMPKFDRMVVDQSITDTGEFHGASPFYWSADGRRLFFVSSDTGATNLYYISSTGGKPTRIFKGKCHIKACSINGKTSIAAFVFADLSNPGDIVVCPTQFGGEKKARKLTDLNPFLRTEVKLGKTIEVLFPGFDGTEIQGLMLFPPNFNKNKKYPAILQIHGGPRAQYAYSFFHEMQYLAANGHCVFYINPRGGSGRGETWAAAISGGWGELDYADCMAAADYMEKQKYIDSRRIGVTGGSYGGYMTNWIIGHTNRFKAAVTQRSISDLKSFVGSSDMGYELNREFNGYHWDNRENYDKCSPITYFKNVKTPVLIIHSEQDLRCPIEQAEQMFVMLKLLKKKVELVRFPEEPHGLSRHGRPDRRVARLEWINRWFKRYLK